MMADILKATEQQIAVLNDVAYSGDRRTFLKFAGMTVAAFTLAACTDDAGTSPTTGSVTLTNDDFGILNYAYALEQLEAAFYTKVTASMYSGASANEQQIMQDIRDHEISHRDFFKAALGANAIGSLSVDFSAIDFTSRTSVLGAAKTFEDLGVSAYNGAGKLLSDVKYLATAGEIVSVEARHAAVIRNLINPGSADFAGDDVVDPATGLDKARKPSEVLALAAPYVTTTINSNLP
jgi:hypothetical protein